MKVGWKLTTQCNGSGYARPLIAPTVGQTLAARTNANYIRSIQYQRRADWGSRTRRKHSNPLPSGSTCPRGGGGDLLRAARSPTISARPLQQPIHKLVNRIFSLRRCPLGAGRFLDNLPHQEWTAGSEIGRSMANSCYVALRSLHHSNVPFRFPVIVTTRILHSQPNQAMHADGGFAAAGDRPNR